MKLVVIDGDYYSTGFSLGSYWKKILRARISAVTRRRKENGVPERILNARVKDFTGTLKTFCPGWLDEAKGIADAAGVSAEDYLKINCLPPGFFSAQKAGNCTSFISIGKTHNLLFKIRDERNHIQSFYSVGRGTFHYQAGHDIGNMGLAHFFSSMGLAGANNTGSVTEDISDEPVMSDCHLLRYMAENASSVYDVPVLAEKLISKGAVGGAGKNRGSILLLADREAGMLLECTSKSFAFKVIKSGLVTVANHFTLPEAKKWESAAPNSNTLLRKKRIDELLQTPSDANNLEHVFKLSRDRKYAPHCLCNDDSKHFWMTISVQLQMIDRKDPGKSMNYACCGNSRHSLFLPFPISERASREPLLSGAYYAAADALYRRFNCARHMAKIQALYERKIHPEPASLSGLYKEAYSILKSL